MRFHDDVRRTAAAFMVMAAMCCAPAAADTSLQDMSDELVANLTEYLEKANVSFFDNSTPVYQAALPSYQPFDPKGMGMLYNFTPMVLDVIVKKDDFLPEGLVYISDGHVEIDSNTSWQTVVVHYLGPIAFILFFILFGLMLPIAGLFWCCCHMCRVGRRRRPFDRKRDSCLRGLLAILLIALLTMFLFGVVCTFATEQQVEQGVGALPAEVRNGSATVRLLLNATAQGIQRKIEHFSNYSQEGVADIFQGISRQLQGSPHARGAWRAGAVRALAGVVGHLDTVQAELRAVQQLTSTLRFQAGQLNSGLRKVKRNLLQTLAGCDMPACVNLQKKHRIGELNTDIQYSQMPDVSDLLNNVTALIDGNIKGEVDEGQRVFRDIQTNIQRTVDDQLPRVRTVYSYISETLNSLVLDVQRQVRQADREIANVERTLAANIERAHEQYGPYRRYAGLGVAVCLLLITCAVSWGLLCGVCGKRPDAYGAADCCNRGAGARGLYCGMALMFVLGGAVCALCAAYFALGAAAQRVLCDPLRDPTGNSVFKLVDKFANIEQHVFRANANASSGFNVSSLIARCHRNDTLYDMFHVTRLINASSIRHKIQQDLALRSAELTPVFPTARIVILKDSAKRKLRLLADCGLSDFQFDRILSALETNMTSLDLPALARTLSRAAAGARAQPGYGRVPQQLADAAAQLDELHRDIVVPMLRHTATLNQTAHKLRDSLRFNHSSLREAVTALLQATAEAEDFLNEKGEDTVRQMVSVVTKFVANNAIRAFDSFTDRETLGRCAPLSAAYNHTADAVCTNLLRPVNGFWVSLAYCALLLLALLPAAARLARLYLQADPYPGPLVEAEYLYDAYADRDNVPLANAYKMDKRLARGERGGVGRGGACGGAGGGAGAARAAEAVAPPLDTHHARRYNDMAPKHWEEGPPRYHGPATEYERPPPYYYPGPNDRQ